MSKIKDCKLFKALSNAKDKFVSCKFCRAVDKVWHNRFFRIVWIRLAFLAILVNLVIECLNRLSFVAGLRHMVTNPLVFLFNTLMVYFTLTFVAFFKKRIFAGTLISAVWIALGIINYAVSDNRVTPFNAPDVKNLEDLADIIDRYFSVGMFIWIAIAIAGVIALIVIICIHSSKIKEKINYFKCGMISAISFGALMLFLNIGNATGLLALNFGNLRQAYRDYGFNYCFMSSLLSSGVKKPRGYSESKVNEVVHPTEEESQTNEEPTTPVPDDTKHTEPVDTPNIIYVQLESLFDPTWLNGLEFSEDPIPNLRKLREEYSSGYFSVPSFGAGTANTEFEVMTGMNLDDFGPGEYPYKTILQKTACESVGYDLKKYGYKINALHDNKGNFYQRNTVFSRLGYDQFTSLEYIYNYDVNPTDWAKDDCLVDEITGMLKYSPEKDFIYCISVQGHGEYPEDTSDMDLKIKVTGNDVTGNPNGFEYYVNQVHEMDQFVAKLVDEVSKIDEHTIIVFYGDHLPTFNINDSDLANGDIMQTPYVIWNNFGMKKIDEDIQAYQLSSVIFERLGMEGGVISQYHMSKRRQEDQSEYLSDLKLLEYDILYGDCVAYNGTLPYTITNMKMGYKYIKINDVKNVGDDVVVTGQNFTWASHIVINGERVSTTVNSEGELVAEGYQVEDGDEIAVIQATSGGTQLSSTSIYVYGDPDSLKEYYDEATSADQAE
ncbi:MAG: sulfatase-like hydrolase/transferase [Lachnospiraceae bacterium]|nr:sulfatase-like hydrolase/transferase [Lachnospiraceae bacterium]